MADTDDDIIETAEKVQHQTGLSKATLIRKRKLPDAGGLPFVRLSVNRIGYRRGDIRAFLSAGRVGEVQEGKLKREHHPAATTRRSLLGAQGDHH